MLRDWNTRFYPIIDTQICETRGLDPRAVAAACFRGGARLLQIRVKAAGSASFLALADDVVAAARTWDATVVVNDRPDIARMAGAGGVHVGHDDLPPDAVRALFGPGLIGLSTHDERQVDEALAAPIDYLAVGPIFETGTKDTGYGARGLRLVHYASGRGKPVVAIGGIDLERAPEVIRAGASAVAVISDLLRENPEHRTRAYLATV
ncbi:MAG: thiamine phosphate synthase [Vicinamibacterales bacterium]